MKAPTTADDPVEQCDDACASDRDCRGSGYDGQCWMIKDKEQVEAAGGTCQDKFGTEGTCWVATSGGQQQQQQSDD